MCRYLYPGHCLFLGTMKSVKAISDMVEHLALSPFLTPLLIQYGAKLRSGFFGVYILYFLLFLVGRTYIVKCQIC